MLQVQLELQLSRLIACAPSSGEEFMSPNRVIIALRSQRTKSNDYPSTDIPLDTRCKTWKGPDHHYQFAQVSDPQSTSEQRNA